MDDEPAAPIARLLGVRPIVATACALFCLALAVRLGWAAALSLDGLYGQDAYYLLEEGEALLHSGRHLGWEAVGAPAVIAAALALGGGQLAAVQMALAVMGALTVVLVVALARALGLPGRVAWIAGGFMALAPEHVAQSLLVMTEGPALFWLMLGILGAVLSARDTRSPWILAATFGLAAAIATRYVMALIAPILAWYLWSRVTSRGSRVQPGTLQPRTPDLRPPAPILSVPSPTRDPRRVTRDALSLLALAVGTAILYIEWRHSQLHIPSGYMLREWSPANAVRREFDDARGQVTLPYPVAVGYLRALGSWAFLSPALLPLAAVGAWRLRQDPAGAFLVLWTVIFVLFLCGLHVVNSRYLLPILPPLVILAAAGLTVPSLVRRPSLLLAATLLALAMSLGTWTRLLPVVARKRCELAVVEWLTEHTPPGSRVAAVDVGLALRRYGSRPVYLLHESDPASWRLPPGDLPGLYVVWDEAFIQRHLAKEPQHFEGAAALVPHVRWLREHARLAPIGNVCHWVVLRVNAPRSRVEGAAAAP
jgi:4-amino-4-deoxy-L-arabinose transferase-like glycosyltransferase